MNCWEFVSWSLLFTLRDLSQANVGLLKAWIPQLEVRQNWHGRDSSTFQEHFSTKAFADLDAGLPDVHSDRSNRQPNLGYYCNWMSSKSRLILWI